MFETTSRYQPIEEATFAAIDRQGSSRMITYKRRRFVPSPDTATTLFEHVVTEGERLDNIAARYLDDPLQFWRLCDTNRVFRPDELTEEVGRVITIAMAGS